MGIADLSFAILLAPLSLAGRWALRHRSARCPAASSRMQRAPSAPCHVALRNAPALPAEARSPSLRPLRVIHLNDASSSARRIVISGRMADVCAELDRLATLENQQAK